MAQIRSFDDLNEYLKQFVPGSIMDGDFYNPKRMFELLPLAGNPHKKFKIVHVAGTSGKTSTCYYIAEMLRASGAQVGLTVSPHIFKINERVQVNGQPLDETEMCQLVNEFVSLPGLLELKPTYFEFIITFAFWVFAKKGCTHAVVEVGLGGLKDATNVVDDPNKVAVITDIGLDHMRILGDTITKITTQKAGIIQNNNHVFCYSQDEVVDKVIDQVVGQKQATLHRLEQKVLEQGMEFLPELPRYQKRNWLLALETTKHVVGRDNLTPLGVKELIQTQKLIIPGRMQRVKIGNKILVFDGAHNPQKLRALMDSLAALYPDKSIAMLIAFMESKRATLQDGLGILAYYSDNFIVTEFEASTDLPHKVIPVGELERAAGQSGIMNITQKSDPLEAFDVLLKQPQDILLVTGSFYLISSLQTKLEEYIR
jgi:dihydrofolate synthase / folylpolyglutamate synthase